MRNQTSDRWSDGGAEETVAIGEESFGESS